jgi:hypothetical protein
LIPLATFKRRVDGMINEIQETKNIDINKVIVMSDEKDPKFWAEVREIGWLQGEGTPEKYGEWYPPIVDIVAQSMTTGFIGTRDSLPLASLVHWHGGSRTGMMAPPSFVTSSELFFHCHTTNIQ